MPGIQDAFHLGGVDGGEGDERRAVVGTRHQVVVVLGVVPALTGAGLVGVEAGSVAGVAPDFEAEGGFVAQFLEFRDGLLVASEEQAGEGPVSGAFEAVQAGVDGDAAAAGHVRPRLPAPVVEHQVAVAELAVGVRDGKNAAAGGVEGLHPEDLVAGSVLHLQGEGLGEVNAVQTELGPDGGGDLLTAQARSGQAEVPPGFAVVGVEGDGLFPVVEGGLPLPAAVVDVAEGDVGVHPLRVDADGLLEEFDGRVNVPYLIVAQGFVVEGVVIWIHRYTSPAGKTRGTTREEVAHRVFRYRVLYNAEPGRWVVRVVRGAGFASRG